MFFHVLDKIYASQLLRTEIFDALFIRRLIPHYIQEKQKLIRISHCFHVYDKRAKRSLNSILILRFFLCVTYIIAQL